MADRQRFEKGCLGPAIASVAGRIAFGRFLHLASINSPSSYMKNIRIHLSLTIMFELIKDKVDTFFQKPVRPSTNPESQVP